MAFLIRAVLGEDATQINLPGFGFAVRLLAFAASQFLRNHGDASAIGADIQNGDVTALALDWLGRALLPLLGGDTDPLDHALNLAGRNADATGVLEVPLGFEVGLFVGPFQAQQLGQSRRVADFQAQRVIGWAMSLVLTGTIIVVTAQREAAKYSLYPEGVAALA